MTPRVRLMVQRFVPDAETWHFVDVGVLPPAIEARRIDIDVVAHPPFSRTMFVFEDARGGIGCLSAVSGEGSVTCGSVGLLPGGAIGRPIRPFAFVVTPEGLRAYANGDVEIDDAKKLLRLLNACFDRIPLSGEAYRPTARKSLINAQRARKGKPPAMYDWTTVAIEPPAAKRDPKGGTHASPRQHDRRGHWRTVRGQRYWVRDCKVGDPALGSRFKDYRIAA